VLTVEIKRETPDHFIQWSTIGDILHKYRSQAVTFWYQNGQKWYEECRVNGNLHRNPLEGPAVTFWYQNGQKSSEEYRVNGKQHRDPGEGPAVTSWHENGQKHYEEYWENGKRVNRKNYPC